VVGSTKTGRVRVVDIDDRVAAALRASVEGVRIQEQQTILERP
jgi:hypothetical protein